MSLLSGALGMGRAQAEARMTDTVEFFTTALVQVPGTLQTIPVETSQGSTVGRVKYLVSQGRDVESGAQFPVVQRVEVHVPVGSVDVLPGVFVRVTASTADASLVGRVFRVAERPQAGQTTAWRYAVEETT